MMREKGSEGKRTGEKWDISREDAEKHMRTKEKHKRKKDGRGKGEPRPFQPF